MPDTQEVAQSTPPRPFLKWAGGKTRLIQQYCRYFPQEFLTYHEPFLGGGAMFFHLQPQRSRLTDVNADLVNVFSCVRDQVDELIGLLECHRKLHSPEHYYRVRSQPEGSDLERAARLIYLNKTCFNGLYRENSKGLFNVPIGRYRNPLICDLETLRSASLALQSAHIELRSFEEVLDYAHDRSDFVYLDPPYYPVSATSRFTEYNRRSFTQEDHVQLRDVFSTLAQRGVNVMLSNSDCSFVRELYQGFSIHTISASRSISSKITKRGKISELLITNW